MPRIKLNLDEINQGFEPIPAGKYNAYVFDIEFQQFKSGSEGYKVTYKIADGQYKGRQLFDNIVLVKSAYWKLGQFWKAVTQKSGVVEIDTSELPSFVGTKVLLDVTLDREVYKGEERERNNVKAVLPAEDGVSDSDDLLSALNEREPVTANVGSPF